jgi:hypothetical protein
VVLTTVESQQPWTLAPACPLPGVVSQEPRVALPSVVVDMPSTRTPGHVIGVTPMAARPKSAQNLGSPSGYASSKPEFQPIQVDGLRGVPPRGRPV